jgi:hypothetical protein
MTSRHAPGADVSRVGSSEDSRMLLDRMSSWVLVVVVCVLLVLGLGVAALLNPGVRTSPEVHHAPPAGLVERD